MAWTPPKTFTATEMLTAAMLNTYLRDNMLETGPAKALDEGGYMVTTGLNAIVQRKGAGDSVTASESRSASTYGDLSTTGPSVTVDTGTRAIVLIYSRVQNDTDNALSGVSFGITGATTVSAGDIRCIMLSGIAGGQYVSVTNMDFYTTLNAGSNTFTMKYRANGTGTSTFGLRKMFVMPF